MALKHPAARARVSTERRGGSSGSSLFLSFMACTMACIQPRGREGPLGLDRHIRG